MRLERPGRPEEHLLEALRGPGPSLTLLGGARGIGKSTLLRSVTRKLRGSGVRVLAWAAPPLPDPDQREAFRSFLAGALDEGDAEPTETAPDLPVHGAGGGPPEWSSLLERLAELPGPDRRTLVVLLDDAHELLGSGPRTGEHLLGLWQSLRSRALPVHLVLAGDPPLLDGALESAPEELRAAVDLDLRPPPLTARELARALPRAAPLEVLRYWAVFGGLPERLRHLDPSGSLRADVRRLVLEPGAPLARAGEEMLRRELQSPPRYASILRALARGARSWGELRRACPDFEDGSRMAPYVRRLESLGLVAVRRSLDAGPRTRNRRYEIVDPFVAFWFGIVLPLRPTLPFSDPDTVWREGVRPALDAHVARLLPRACRDWLAGHGDEVLPGRARVLGGLWGGGFDLDPAGTLRTGGVFYGLCVHGDAPADAGLFDSALRQLRQTRYGIGRESRHRVVFSTGGFTADALREAARTPTAHAVGLERIVGRRTDGRTA